MSILESTIRLSALWNTVVKIKPEFTFPPSDPDPLHHFSTRNRCFVNNFSSYTSINSLASSKRLPVGTGTPRKPSNKDRACCCACHDPVPASPAIQTSTPVQGSTKRTRFEEVGAHFHVVCIIYMLLPIRALLSIEGNPPFMTGLRPSEKSSLPFANLNLRFLRGVKGYDVERSIAVSEMGELSIRVGPVKVETRTGTYSRIKASFKSWSTPSQAARLKRPTRPQPKVKKSVGSKEAIDAHRPKGVLAQPMAGCTTEKAADSSFLSMSGRAEKTVGRRLRRVDGSIVSANRFGWVLGSSRKSGKGSYSMKSVAARPEANAATNCITSPPRPRASLINLSPIMEDVHSFPSVGDLNSNFDTFSMLGGDPDQNTTDGRYQDEEYQDGDSRNFDHMNLSGSFVLQSTSWRDISRARHSETNGEESVPALVLTFPTPEPPKSPVFAPQSPFMVHKFAPAMALGTSASSSTGGGQQISRLAVPALPRCTHCGFGFGLDLDDLEMPLNSNPCRFCETQWLACKMWYQAKGSSSLLEPCPVRPAESSASSRAIVGKLGLPIGNHRGLGLDAADELGQLNTKVAEGCSNVIVNDRTRTTKRTAVTVWKKITRLFGTQERVRAADKYSRQVDNMKADPERRRREWISAGLDHQHSCQ
ncbi:hypothetical protein MVEN_01502000 [Mycena venus]|uniref:Uncharacterized protein n=1 Tax=Mycena venus TaxID=2733690 RepID=A0A8H6XSU4_9AGAR|nr:hypothetical protein MVEN_01502000 [Mycena venus]